MSPATEQQAAPAVPSRGQFRSWVVNEARRYTRLTESPSAEKPQAAVLTAPKGTGFEFRPGYYGQKNARVRRNDCEGRLQDEAIEKLVQETAGGRESVARQSRPSALRRALPFVVLLRQPTSVVLIRDATTGNCAFNVRNECAPVEIIVQNRVRRLGHLISSKVGQCILTETWSWNIDVDYCIGEFIQFLRDASHSASMAA
jgi:hypothetical protein